MMLRLPAYHRSAILYPENVSYAIVFFPFHWKFLCCLISIPSSAFVHIYHSIFLITLIVDLVSNLELRFVTLGRMRYLLEEKKNV